MRIFQRKWIYRTGLFIMMLIIFFFSHQPGEVSTKVSNAVANTLQIEQQSEHVSVSTQPLFAGLNIRKYAHIILYFLLGVFAVLSVKENQQKWYVKLFTAFIICFLYSCSDELHQMFVPGREASIRDLCVDSIGYGIAIVFGLVVVMYRKCIA